MPRSSKRLPVKSEDILIGALVRVRAQAIHRRTIQELNAAGFGELRLPHMATLQFPEPDGVRPTTLAERAGMSKQPMNQLLRSLACASRTRTSATNRSCCSTCISEPWRAPARRKQRRCSAKRATNFRLL